LTTYVNHPDSYFQEGLRKERFFFAKTRDAKEPINRNSLGHIWQTTAFICYKARIRQIGLGLCEGSYFRQDQ